MDLDGVCMTKKAGALIPADIHAEDWLSGVKDGREVIVTLRRPRNPKHHRWAFAVMATVVANSTKWRTVEALLDDLKFVTGLYEKRLNMLSGEVQAVPKSISFAAMDQDRFRAWFDLALEHLSRAIGVDPVTLLQASGVRDYEVRK